MRAPLLLSVVLVQAGAPPAPAGDGEYRLEEILPSRERPRTAPDGIPEALAKLLEPGGLRLLDREGKALCELWLRAEIPLPEKPGAEMNVRVPRLAPGTFVGAMNALGGTADYRDLPIEAGLYGLRYFHQPTDGNHLGTSDSRDFLILTSLAHDTDPAPVADLQALVDLSLPISMSDHAVVLYVAEIHDDAAAGTADPPAPKPDPRAPRLFQREGREEWAVALTLRGRAPAAAETEDVRLALVLVGHTAE